MNIIFTVDQLNQLLAVMDQLPYRFAKPLIDQIQSIAGPQMAAQQQAQAVNIEAAPVDEEVTE